MPSSSDLPHLDGDPGRLDLRDGDGDADGDPYGADEHGDVPDGFPRVSRLNVWLLVASITSLCAALYMSPLGTDVRQQVQDSVRAAVPGLGDDQGVDRAVPADAHDATGADPVSGSGAEASRSPAAGRPSGGPPPGRARGADDRGDGDGVGTAVIPLDPGTDRRPGGQVAALRPGPAPGTRPTEAPTKSPSPLPEKTECWQFRWQQDAQVVYLQNLSDPHGLDAEPGPQDGDGLACSDLPVDPARAASTPVGAYSPPKPTVAAKRELVRPPLDYFGFTQSGLPGDTAMLEGLARRAGKAPSSVGWFSSFDEGFRGDLVEKSWNHGALPVITWMPVDSGSGTSYSLTSIVAGTHDRYLRRYAGDVVRGGLPVVLRFAHEMNGNWYGWSAGRTDYNNTPEKYVAAWRHVWQVFDDVGATDQVIWLWSPSRVDNLRPSPTNGLTPIAADYPGDSYVDWLGASVYLRSASVGPTFEASFARTVGDLEAVSDKPVFVAETAAAQTDGGVDQTELKAAWTRNMVEEFARDDRLVGFLWFNDIATAAVNGVEVRNDWRFDATKDTAAAFREAVDDPEIAGGVVLD